MEQERIINLVIRQLKDIQSQADKILSGDNSNEAIESFARYSIELKEYITKKINNEKAKELGDKKHRKIVLE